MLRIRMKSRDFVLYLHFMNKLFGFISGKLLEQIKRRKTIESLDYFSVFFFRKLRQITLHIVASSVCKFLSRFISIEPIYYIVLCLRIFE